MYVVGGVPWYKVYKRRVPKGWCAINRCTLGIDRITVDAIRTNTKDVVNKKYKFYFFV